MNGLSDTDMIHNLQCTKRGRGPQTRSFMWLVARGQIHNTRPVMPFHPGHQMLAAESYLNYIFQSQREREYDSSCNNTCKEAT